ncbi:hypothetical protein PSTT_02937, partial [Puccinia striiformis]
AEKLSLGVLQGSQPRECAVSSGQQEGRRGELPPRFENRRERKYQIDDSTSQGDSRNASARKRKNQSVTSPKFNEASAGRAMSKYFLLFLLPFYHHLSTDQTFLSQPILNVDLLKQAITYLILGVTYGG